MCEVNLFSTHPGLKIIKVTNSKLLQTYGVTKTPATLYFRSGYPLTVEGEMLLKNTVTILCYQLSVIVDNVLFLYFIMEFGIRVGTQHMCFMFERNLNCCIGRFIYLFSFFCV